MNNLVAGVNATLSSIGTALAVFNESSVRQKDLMIWIKEQAEISQRVSWLEGKMNDKP
jgi:hypothetical protein